MFLLAAFSPFALFKLIPLGEMAAMSALEGQGRKAVSTGTPRLSTAYYLQGMRGRFGSTSKGSAAAGLGGGSAGPMAGGMASGGAAGGAAAAAGPAAVAVGAAQLARGATRAGTSAARRGTEGVTGATGGDRGRR
jgi:hypothetical protein